MFCEMRNILYFKLNYTLYNILHHSSARILRTCRKSNILAFILIYPICSKTKQKSCTFKCFKSEPIQ